MDHLISPDVALSVSAIAMVLVTDLMFSMFGMLVNKSQTLTLFSRLTIVSMTFLCSTLFDIDALPFAATMTVYLLPLTHVSNIIRGLMLDTGVLPDSVLIMAAYMVLFFAVYWWMIKTNRC